jgi:hypothetical protein
METHFNHLSFSTAQVYFYYSREERRREERYFTLQLTIRIPLDLILNPGSISISSRLETSL